MKRKSPPTSDHENPDQGTSRRDGDENPHGHGGTRRDETPANTSPSNRRVSRREVNFDELPYDPADRRKISDYIGQNLHDKIRRKYLIRDPFKPSPAFKYPEKTIVGHPRLFHPE